MESSTFSHPGITITRGTNGVSLEADSEALRAWATRPGSSWPCSVLADLRGLACAFDSDGDLVELEEMPWDGEPLELLPADEFDAFTSDVL